MFWVCIPVLHMKLAYKSSEEALKIREIKTISTVSFFKTLRNNYTEFKGKAMRQFSDTTIGTKIAVESEFQKFQEFNPMVCYCYTDENLINTIVISTFHHRVRTFIMLLHTLNIPKDLLYTAAH